ncbi:MAG TPA: type II CAAX endopeptidase family protein [Longimicrobiales bacterium]
MTGCGPASGDSEEARSALPLALAGVALLPLLALGFVTRFGLPVLDAVFLALLLELMPVLAVAQIPLARSAPLERMPAYLGSAVTILVLGSVALGLGLRAGGGAGLGLDPFPPAGSLLVWTAGVTLSVGILVGVFHVAGRLLDLDETSLLLALIPRTRRERLAFVGLSVAAGLGEEITFRGYAIPTLAPFVGGEWPAAVLTCLSFGVLHAYQGPVGMVRTFFLGFLLAASFLILGTLWPAIIAHILVDLVGGLWLGPWLVRARDRPGENPPPGEAPG